MYSSLTLGLRLSVAATFAVLTLANANGQPPDDLRPQIEALTREYLSRPGRVGLAIGILQKGRTNFASYGSVAKDRVEVPTQQTIFEIGSISKTITGTLLAKAVVDGKLSLDDDVRKFLPKELTNLAFENEPIRVKHLLNHTSGLPFLLPHTREDFNDMNADRAAKLNKIQADFSKQDLLKGLGKVALTKKPGVDQSYSNTAARVCSIILEEVNKKPFEEQLKQFFAKLEMINTFACAELVDSNAQARFAVGYSDKGEPMPRTPHSMMAAGGIVSCAEDMLRYAQYHLDESNAAASLSHQPTWGDIRYYAAGLNWQMERKESAPARIWQSGTTGGFTSYLQMYPDEKMAIVLLTNESDRNSENELSNIVAQIYKLLNP